MQTWAYPAVVVAHGPDDFVVTFPDVPEAITGGGSRAEALLSAADALEEAILGYMADGVAIPLPRAARKGEELVVLDPVTAARAVLAIAMKAGRVSNTALAAKLGKSEGAIRRLTDGETGVKIDTVLQALAAVGKRTALTEVA
jgi:antitoxin HicB